MSKDFGLGYDFILIGFAKRNCLEQPTLAIAPCGYLGQASPSEPDGAPSDPLCNSKSLNTIRSSPNPAGAGW